MIQVQMLNKIDFLHILGLQIYLLYLLLIQS